MALPTPACFLSWNHSLFRQQKCVIVHGCGQDGSILANKNAKKNDEYPAIFMEQAWSIFKGLITWPKRELIIAGPTPSVQEGLIFSSRMVTIGQEMVKENYSSMPGKSQRISLWVRENLSLWKVFEILRVHIFFYQFMDTPRDLLKAKINRSEDWCEG